jgi:hypothetical protein
MREGYEGNMNLATLPDELKLAILGHLFETSLSPSVTRINKQFFLLAHSHKAYPKAIFRTFFDYLGDQDIEQNKNSTEREWDFMEVRRHSLLGLSKRLVSFVQQYPSVETKKAIVNAFIDAFKESYTQPNPLTLHGTTVCAQTLPGLSMAIKEIATEETDLNDYNELKDLVFGVSHPSSRDQVFANVPSLLWIIQNPELRLKKFEELKTAILDPTNRLANIDRATAIGALLSVISVIDDPKKRRANLIELKNAAFAIPNGWAYRVSLKGLLIGMTSNGDPVKKLGSFREIKDQVLSDNNSDWIKARGIATLASMLYLIEEADERLKIFNELKTATLGLQSHLGDAITGLAPATWVIQNTEERLQCLEELNEKAKNISDKNQTAYALGGLAKALAPIKIQASHNDELCFEQVANKALEIIDTIVVDSNACETFGEAIGLLKNNQIRIDWITQFTKKIEEMNSSRYYYFFQHAIPAATGHIKNPQERLDFFNQIKDAVYDIKSIKDYDHKTYNHAMNTLAEVVGDFEPGDWIHCSVSLFTSEDLCKEQTEEAKKAAAALHVYRMNSYFPAPTSICITRS